MAGRVLATSRNVLLVRDEFAEQFKAAGLELVLSPKLGVPHQEAELLELLPGCVAAVAMPDRYTERVIEAAAPAVADLGERFPVTTHVEDLLDAPVRAGAE